MSQDPSPHTRLPWGMLAALIVPTLVIVGGLALYALALIGA